MSAKPINCHRCGRLKAPYSRNRCKSCVMALKASGDWDDIPPIRVMSPKGVTSSRRMGTCESCGNWKHLRARNMCKRCAEGLTPSSVAGKKPIGRAVCTIPQTGATLTGDVFARGVEDDEPVLLVRWDGTMSQMWTPESGVEVVAAEYRGGTGNRTWESMDAKS